MKNRIIPALCLLAIFGIFHQMMPIARAQTPTPQQNAEQAPANQTAADEKAPPITLTNPLGFEPTTEGVTQRLVGLSVTMLQALIVLSILPILFGSFLWITSRGSSDRVEKGKKIFYWGTVGLILGLLATAIINQIFEAVGV